MNLVEKLVSLAQEIESEDPIDWGMLEVSEEEVYKLVANQILEMYLISSPENRDEILLASCIKLSVENFVLQLKLLNKV